MAKTTVPRHRDAEALSGLLDTPEIRGLIADLEATRWTGRPGYPIRAMVGMCLIKALYVIPTWSRVVRLVAEHEALQRVLGATPSADAAYRFTRKLRTHSDALTACIDAVLASLAVENPAMGDVVAMDGSDLPAYSNGQGKAKGLGPDVVPSSDPDASWGHRSAVSTRSAGFYFGYKLHVAVDVATELPVAWELRSARDGESPLVPGLLDETRRRGFGASIAILDKGYDKNPVYNACQVRGIRPIIPLCETTKVKAGLHSPNKCGHGTWVFAGADMKRGAAKWRCPTGQCLPTASMWVPASRLHTLIPRTTDRWSKLYRQRGSVERGFGRLKHEFGMLPLRVRRIDRVRLHVDLAILAQLVTALTKARAVPLAA